MIRNDTASSNATRQSNFPTSHHAMLSKGAARPDLPMVKVFVAWKSETPLPCEIVDDLVPVPGR